jgi:hypothetical protein
LSAAKVSSGSAIAGICYPQLRKNGYNPTINKVTRDDKGVSCRQETVAVTADQILQGGRAAADKRVMTMRLAAAAAKTACWQQ